MSQIQFGTDGWRAVIAEGFTFENVARVAQAAADHWKAEGRRQKAEGAKRELKVVMGFDRRFFSDRFAQLTAEVLAGNGFRGHPDAGADTNAVGFVCGQKSKRRGWRDDYGQP